MSGSGSWKSLSFCSARWRSTLKDPEPTSKGMPGIGVSSPPGRITLGFPFCRRLDTCAQRRALRRKMEADFAHAVHEPLRLALFLRFALEAAVFLDQSVDSRR